MFPGYRDSSLHVLAYLDLLNGISAHDRIAFAASAAAEPPTTPRARTAMAVTLRILGMAGAGTAPTSRTIAARASRQIRASRQSR
jgi:hypothetical protein